MNFGTSWTDTERKDYAYDGQGRLVTETVYNGTTGTWEPYRRYEYTWSDGLLVSGLGYQNFGGTWIEVWSRTCVYDLDGLLVQDVVDDYNGDCIDGTTRHDYSWDEAGRLARDAGYYRPLGGEWAGTWARDYEYDLLGRLTEELESYASGADWIPSTWHQYTWDAEGRLACASTANRNTGSWAWSGRRSYSFDEEGRVEEVLDEGYSYGTWNPTAKTVYSRDDRGAPFASTGYAYSGGTWVESYRSTRTVLDVPSGVKQPEDSLNAPRPLDYTNWTLYGEPLNRWALE